MVPVWISGFLAKPCNKVVSAVSVTEAVWQPVAQPAVAVTTLRLSPMEARIALTVTIQLPPTGILVGVQVMTLPTIVGGDPSLPLVALGLV